MKTEKFQRKPFVVDAVRVTEENLAEVALWCQGEVRMRVDVVEKSYIKVRVMHPLNEKQSMAFVGDWVLYAGTGFKVYTHKAFQRSFESVFEEPTVVHVHTYPTSVALPNARAIVEHMAQKGLSIGG